MHAIFAKDTSSYVTLCLEYKAIIKSMEKCFCEEDHWTNINAYVVSQVKFKANIAYNLMISAKDIPDIQQILIKIIAVESIGCF